MAAHSVAELEIVEDIEASRIVDGGAWGRCQCGQYARGAGHGDGSGAGAHRVRLCGPVLMGGSASPFSFAGEPLFASSTTPTLPADQLQAMLNNAVSDGGIPGAVLAVKTKWGTWIGAAGKASLSANQAMTTNTQVRLAGVTKPFTAALSCA